MLAYFRSWLPHSTASNVSEPVISSVSDVPSVCDVPIVCDVPSTSDVPIVSAAPVVVYIGAARNYPDKRLPFSKIFCVVTPNDLKINLRKVVMPPRTNSFPFAGEALVQACRQKLRHVDLPIRPSVKDVFF